MQGGVKVSQMQLPMGVDVTPDIFQSTMMDKNGRHQARSQAYMDETLIITNGMLTENTQQLETVLKKAQRQKLQPQQAQVLLRMRQTLRLLAHPPR
jgi:hypothetical protein